MDITLLTALRSNDVILTPNQRLANTLQKQLQDHHYALGNRAFIPPILLSFSQFIRTLWNAYIFISPKKLLSSDEEEWLWQSIIHQSDISKGLLNKQKISSLVQSAWHDLKQWRLNPDQFSLEAQNNESLYFFTGWSKKFMTLCSKRNFIDESSALEAYANNSSFIQSLPYQNFYFYHFIETTPLQEFFIASLKQYHKSVTIIEQSPINKTLIRFEPKTTKEEMLAMATWAKEKYTENNEASIGCVIPNLHQQREKILRTFKTVFNTPTPPIDISAGYLLAEFTVIQHMLLIMALLTPTFDYETLSTYLRSAYFGNSEEEMAQHHLLDIELRKKCSKTISLQQTIDIASSLRVLEASHLSSGVSDRLLRVLAMTTSEKMTLQEWCHRWLNLLKELNWPGQRNLSSTEYQVTQRFIKLMQEVEDFCTLQTNWTWHEFSSLIKTKCQQTVFQPEKEKTSIQILGLLEASGMIFDHCWIMSLDDKTWPSAPSPNPFLPYQLQKKYGMPHASAEREYVFCKTLQEQLIQSSTETIISSAMHDEDHELNPSPLITTIPKHAMTSNEVSPQRRLTDTLNIKNEYITDNIAPPVLENEKITGGTSLIQHQALCPFKAFAIHRLNANQIAQPIDVPNALIRGNRIHRALELFWKNIKTSENLLKLSTHDLNFHIKKSIDITYDEQNDQDVFFTSLEKIRLNKLMHAWLDIEKNRPAFKVIAVEQKREYQYKHITLRMCVDRIDELDDGQHVIIDYKTGSPNIQHWLGRRLKEPQLPIYCMSHPVTVSAMFFAQLRWNDLTIKGIADGGCEIKTVTAFGKLAPEMRAPTWLEQKSQWKNSIDQLLEDFINGHAAVDPLDQTTCTHCHLQALCRIFE
ncbi:MAG: PD-(D/E)XK nuclease family protein [Pseudomonadota bacterium]